LDTQPVYVVLKQISDMIRWCPAIYKTCSRIEQ